MKLIDKDAVMAEIENLLDNNTYLVGYDCVYRDGNNGALYALKGRLDTLETREVDVEKEIKDYLRKQPIVARSRLVPSLEKIAKHFFELGMLTSNKTQKGE